MECRNLNADILLAAIKVRRLQQLTYLGMLPLGGLMLTAALGFTVGTVGIILGAVLTLITLYPLIRCLRISRHPEKSVLFRKYGTPEKVAGLIAKNCREPFFENERMIVTKSFILDTQNPESLVPLKEILLAYASGKPHPFAAKGEYITVLDSCGSRFHFPYAVGETQILKSSVILDYLQKHSAGCRVGKSRANLEYVKSKCKEKAAKESVK